MICIHAQTVRRRRRLFSRTKKSRLFTRLSRVFAMGSFTCTILLYFKELSRYVNSILQIFAVAVAIANFYFLNKKCRSIGVFSIAKCSLAPSRLVDQYTYRPSMGNNFLFAQITDLSPAGFLSFASAV